jgi:hypothetical protein
MLAGAHVCIIDMLSVDITPTSHQSNDFTRALLGEGNCSWLKTHLVEDAIS